MNWLHNNKMVVNPNKFQVILRGSNNTNVEVKIRKEKIKLTSSVKLLGVQIKDNLNFNHHINKLCKRKSVKCSNTTKVILRS